MRPSRRPRRSLFLVLVVCYLVLRRVLPAATLHDLSALRTSRGRSRKSRSRDRTVSHSWGSSGERCLAWLPIIRRDSSGQTSTNSPSRSRSLNCRSTGKRLIGRRPRGAPRDPGHRQDGPCDRWRDSDAGGSHLVDLLWRRRRDDLARCGIRKLARLVRDRLAAVFRSTSDLDQYSSRTSSLISAGILLRPHGGRRLTQLRRPFVVFTLRAHGTD